MITETIFSVRGKDHFRIEFFLDEYGKAYKITGMYAEDRYIEYEKE